MVDVDVIVGVVSFRVRCQIVFLFLFRHVIPVYPSQYTNDTDSGGLLLGLLADSECAFCAGCQLRRRMPRSAMMHRGCGRPVRTLRTFSYDRAAPSGPVLYFLCAKQMTPILVACFWGSLLIRSALSALDASCDCACHDQA